MALSFTVLFAALAQNSCAYRFNPLAQALGLQGTPHLAPHAIRSHGALSHGVLSHGSSKAPRRVDMALHMVDRGDDIPEVWKPQTSVPTNWRADLADEEAVWDFSQPNIFPYSSLETFPPRGMYGIHTWQILETWAEWTAAAQVSYMLNHMNELPDGDKDKYSFEEYGDNGEELLFILEKMKWDMTGPGPWGNNTFGYSTLVPTQRGTLEAVGLLPKISPEDTVSSEDGRVDDSVLALAIFSRVELKDNSNGSLLRDTEVAQAESGMEATRAILGRDAGSVSAFAIEGIAEAPHLSARSVRVLLAKIAQWAQAEQRIVVVARHAIRFSDDVNDDDVDLTSHYIRLGFQKVELHDGSYDLVYSGLSTNSDLYTSDTDQWFGDRYFMARVNASSRSE